MRRRIRLRGRKEMGRGRDLVVCEAFRVGLESCTNVERARESVKLDDFEVEKVREVDNRPLTRLRTRVDQIRKHIDLHFDFVLHLARLRLIDLLHHLDERDSSLAIYHCRTVGERVESNEMVVRRERMSKKLERDMMDRNDLQDSGCCDSAVEVSRRYRDSCWTIDTDNRREKHRVEGRKKPQNRERQGFESSDRGSDSNRVQDSRVANDSGCNDRMRRRNSAKREVRSFGRRLVRHFFALFKDTHKRLVRFPEGLIRFEVDLRVILIVSIPPTSSSSSLTSISSSSSSPSGMFASRCLLSVVLCLLLFKMVV